MARFDIYTQVATATRLNREDVKKVIQAYHRMDNDKEFHIEGGNGGSYIELQQRETGMVFLEVGETCVVTVKRVISVRALAVILTQAQDIGFEQMINDYCRNPTGIANVPLDQDLPKGKRNADGTWPSEGDVK